MERQTIFVDVLLPLAVQNLFTYRVPLHLNDFVQTGKRTIVPFGKGKFYTAIIVNIHHQPPSQYQAKYLEEIIDEVPVVSSKQLELWNWIASYYMCTRGEVMNAALPSGLKLSSETQITLNTFRKNEDEVPLSDHELSIIAALEFRNVLSLKDVEEITGIKSYQKIIRGLLSKGLILTYEEVKSKFKPKIISCIKLSPEWLNDVTLQQQTFTQLEKRAPRQLELLLFVLREHKQNLSKRESEHWMEREKLSKEFDASAIRSLVKKGVFVEQNFERSRIKQTEDDLRWSELNEVQQEAFEKINESFKSKPVCLLHGVTGSGKTEIYAHLIREIVDAGRQVLFLVPEIALTTQLVNRMRAFYGDCVGVYHSRFSENERVELWNDLVQQHHVSNGRFKIILGARSALFLPFSDLGLVIVDEEHDASFKQYDPSPRYNARDTAIFLASLFNAKVLLGTATPAIESYHNAKTKRYGMVELASRYGNATLPDIKIADSRSLFDGKNRKIFTEDLTNEIELALSKKEQVILFQNRRGFAPYTSCNTCGWVPMCHQCDVALIYHKSPDRLICHYCGFVSNPPSSCGKCGNTDLRQRGFGTERIEDEVSVLFPQAKIARMDLDTTRSKYAYQQLIENFEDGEIDILVGTQMVTKGLDFENVSLVGVLDADQMLNFPDFRSFERSFQLLSQVSGRSGRKDKPGKVIIQTSQLNHPVINWVKTHDYSSFFANQIDDRERFQYPPFFRLTELNLISPDLDVLNYGAEKLADRLKENQGIGKVLGPEFPLVAKIRNEFYKRILIKTARKAQAFSVKSQLAEEINRFVSKENLKKFRIKINVDPL